MKIIISNNVKLAINDIHSYLSKRSTKYANETIFNIYLIIESLQNSPYIGRYVPELKNKSFRERIYKKFRIIYYISEETNTIYIQYIFSGRQNSNLFFEVHKKELNKFLNQFFY